MDTSKTDGSRRAFLGLTAVAAGGVVLGLPGLGRADDAVKDEKAGADGDVVLKLKEHDDLKKVGGFEVVDTDAGKVIVACTDVDNYVACSAVCTHKGGILRYEHDSKQFVCPRHGARYDLNGKVVQGPAQHNVASYSTGSAAVIEIKPKA